MADCDTYDGQSGCEDSDPTSGLYKDIMLYQSEELGDWCERQGYPRTRALDNAKTYIEGAFDRTDHTVSVSIGSQECDPPAECNQDETFYGTHPCADGYLYWSGTAEWVKEWVNCKGVPTGDTQTIVLTDCGSTAGGVGGDVAWTQTGRNVAELPTSYDLMGSSDAYAGMATVLHEIGHKCMKGSCKSYDVSDHHYGESNWSYYYSDYMTPMGRWTCVDPDENVCCDDHTVTDGDQEHANRMAWSDCCLAVWRC